MKNKRRIMVNSNKMKLNKRFFLNININSGKKNLKRMFGRNLEYYEETPLM